MSKEFETKIKKSIGYVNTIKALDNVFGKDYTIQEFIPSDDETSVDFTLIINLPKLAGIDLGVSSSGSHMYQIGDGTVDLDVPVEKSFFKSATGKPVEPLYKVLKDDTIMFGASANKLEKVENYFALFKKYYEENYVNI
jgi:hypothetical protein